MKKHILLFLICTLVLGIASVGFCAQPVSYENGDFTIDGITIGENIKEVRKRKGKPDISDQSVKSRPFYSYTAKCSLLCREDGTIWYIATNTVATARQVKALMTKEQMIAAYGDGYELVESDNSLDYEYLGEDTKLVFRTNADGIIMQIDCKKYK